MKALSTFLALVALTSSFQFASADVVDSVVVSDGTTLTTLTASANPGDYATGSSAVLQSLISGGVTYDTLIAPDSYAGNATDVLTPVGTPASAFPSVSDALIDLDISTGTLNTFRDPQLNPNEFFNFTSQQTAGAITSETVFFLFVNETGTGSVTLVDSNGAAISNTLTRSQIGDEAQLSDFTFARASGGNLEDINFRGTPDVDREVFGNTFAVSEFIFEPGFGVADVAGFQGGDSDSADANDAGIATIAAVPEPSSVILLVGGLGAFLARRRRDQ